MLIDMYIYMCIYMIDWKKLHVYVPFLIAKSIYSFVISVSLGLIWAFTDITSDSKYGENVVTLIHKFQIHGFQIYRFGSKLVGSKQTSSGMKFYLFWLYGHICICPCIYVYMNIFVFVYYLYVYIYTYTHAYIYTYMYIHTHTHAYI
jgi:hypothetical protein